ncbi:hypothetical protein INT47_007585 [Mucor saturninus]|uniref:serine--tRNA ligase n=1 Tax=Mucor saturninus TaxID=64648 RepID=A0A8H7VA45_9FUNG|nr:hypothetical protein INT47_007585 [Mucor saturninus]
MFKQILSKRAYSKAVGFQPKLDYTALSNHASAITQNMKARNHVTVDMTEFVRLNEKRLSLYNQLTALRSKRNEVSLATQAATSKEARSVFIAEGQQIKAQVKRVQEDLSETEEGLLERGLRIPNETHGDSPVGSESQARVVKIVGTPRKEEGLKDHVEIAQGLNILDLEQAAVASGSSFYYLQGMGAFLEMALVQYAMHKAASRGFMGVMTPDIVRTQLAYGCGFQPKRGESSQIYGISEDQCLAGTAEIPLAGKFATRLLNEEELPQKLVGFGHAFRTEAGGRGLTTKGLYRVHQFSKVELFAVTTHAQSEDMMAQILKLQEDIFTDLGLCFRILDMPTEELGASAYRKFDMEAWMPGRGTWGEISSTSNCTDYQSRRLSIRYRPKYQTGDQHTRFCHTLNGTAMAVPRMIIAILETFQRKDGSVEIPRVLQKWLPGEPSHLFV